MARVFVTRAAPQAQATGARVRALGHAPIVSPVLEIEPVQTPFETRFDWSAVRALVFTSAAALRALPGEARGLRVPVFVVGDATAQAARAAGFSSVRSANGAGADLVRLVQSELAPGAGPIVHGAGADVAEDIDGALRAAGYDARRVTLYRAVRARALSAEAVSALRAGVAAPDGVLFHSARGAEAFAQLAREMGLAHVCAELAALCLSPRVAEAAKALHWRAILVAPAPREDALLSLLPPVEGERT